MRKWLTSLGSFWFGAVMGAATLTLFALMEGALSWFLPGPPENLLYQYQTLLTGILAVVAAFFSVRETRRQIREQSEQERENADAVETTPLGLPCPWHSMNFAFTPKPASEN